jgi:hypothetical protein
MALILSPYFMPKSETDTQDLALKGTDIHDNMIHMMQQNIVFMGYVFLVIILITAGKELYKILKVKTSENKI